MIQLYNLSKAFGERVLLEDVTWQITGGERVGLCGPNGAGKTTLLRMLAGLDEPDAGQIIRPGGCQSGICRRTASPMKAGRSSRKSAPRFRICWT